jgi:hypothetical protein
MVRPCGTLSAITRMSNVVSVLVSVVLVYWRPRPFGPSLASVDEDVQTRPNLGLQIWKASANELADTDSNWRR